MTELRTQPAASGGAWLGDEWVMFVRRCPTDYVGFWFPLTRDADEISVGAERIREAWVDAGREPAALRVRAHGAIRR